MTEGIDWDEFEEIISTFFYEAILGLDTEQEEAA
jgi:hypothetical protein